MMNNLKALRLQRRRYLPFLVLCPIGRHVQSANRWTRVEEALRRVAVGQVLPADVRLTFAGVISDMAVSRALLFDSVSAALRLLLWCQ